MNGEQSWSIIPHGWDGQDVPFDGHVELAEIDAHVHDRRSGPFLQVTQVDLESVVRPAAKLEDARLLVEREVLDVDFTAGLVDGRGFPFDQARVVHRGFG